MVQTSLIIVSTLVTATITTFVIRRILHHFITEYSTILKVDPTNFSFLKNSISFLIYILALIFIFNHIPSLKSVGTTLFAGAGVFAAVIGFASQKAFSNIISGIFILIFKPFHVDDWIEISTKGKGRVEEITLRHTIICNNENRRIIIPNSIISEETIINSDLIDEKVRKHIEIPISLKSNINLAMDIIQEEAVKHPFCIDNRTNEQLKKEIPDPIVVVRLIRITDFSIILKAYVWTIGNDNAFLLECDLLKAVIERFEESSVIDIPYPQQIVTLKK